MSKISFVMSEGDFWDIWDDLCRLVYRVESLEEKGEILDKIRGTFMKGFRYREDKK